jgi:hypothetical protein
MTPRCSILSMKREAGAEIPRQDVLCPGNPPFPSPLDDQSDISLNYDGGQLRPDQYNQHKEIEYPGPGREAIPLQGRRHGLELRHPLDRDDRPEEGIRIDILFYQEPLWDAKYKPYSPMGYAVHLRPVLHDELGREPKSQDEVMSSLKKYRYKAVLVRATESGRLTEKDSKLLARTFSFRPHRFSLNRIINYTEKQIEAMELLRLEGEWDEEFQ